MVTANPDQSVNFFLHNPHDVYERFRRGALIYGPFGGPQGPPKKPVEKNFSKKYLQKGGQNNRKLPNLPRSKVLQTKFFFQKLENFWVGFPRIYPKIISKKMFSERGVKSTGNDLICQDTKPWKQLFFQTWLFFFVPDGWTNGRTNGQANRLTKRDVESLARD